MTQKKKSPHQGRARRVPQDRIDRFADGIVAGDSGVDSAIGAGMTENRNSAKVIACEMLKRPEVAAAIERRREEFRRRAQFHTDELVGMLFEISTASLSDVLEPDGTFDPVKCIERGTDHLIKKVRRTERHSKDGSSRVTYDYEMYSRLDAIDQLRETFGMKQEPRPNNYDETRKAEVERSINRIMERDGIDQPTAARKLIEELGDSPQLVQIVSQYAN